MLLLHPEIQRPKPSRLEYHTLNLKLLTLYPEP